MVNIVVVCWNAVNYSIITLESLIESLREQRLSNYNYKQWIS